MKDGLFLVLCLLPLCLPAQKNPLHKLLKQHADKFEAVLSNPQHQVQIVYTQIDRDASNQPRFTTYTWGLDTTLYFYPASTVKMPTALLALEKLNALQIVGLDKHAAMQHGAATHPQTPVAQDSTSANGLPSVAHYIRKLFIVSDNDAHNRLYEFLGQEYLNHRLWEKGYRRIRILHRLAAPNYTPETNRYTNPVRFFQPPNHPKAGELLYYQGEVHSEAKPTFAVRNELCGKGYLNAAGELVPEPFDFRWRNFASLLDLHHILQAVMFPEYVPAQRRFHLSPDDYRFLWRCMSELPRQSDYPRYPEKDYPDSYVKFLMYGNSKARIPDHIRIFNKVGNAYGYLTDVAYIVDFEHGVEFMLSATIHVNANQIYNDGVYEYEQIGYPFLAELGKTVYQYELKRPRKFRPDLSRFR